jgi:hypothetical protein
VRRRWSACDISTSGKTAIATAKTMMGMLIIKSAIAYGGNHREVGSSSW